MKTPDSPADISLSPAGDIADKPTDVTVIAVTDKDDDTVGYLNQWRSDEWFYAEMEAFEYLSTLQEADD